MSSVANTVTRPALGCVAQFGDIFDAQTETFLGVSIFKDQLPAACIISTDSNTTKLDFLKTESLAEKVERYEFTANMTLNFLSGLLGNVGGSGRYLQEQRSSRNSVRSSLIYSLETKVEALNLNKEEIRQHLVSNALRHQEGNESPTLRGTHVVTRIDWGAKIIVTAEAATSNDSNSSEAKAATSASLDKLMSNINLTGSVGRQNDTKTTNSLNNYSLKMHGDVLPKKVPKDMDEVQELVRNLSVLLQDCNGGKGKPIAYGLLPINMVQQCFNLPQTPQLWHTFREDLAHAFVKLFDQVTELKFKVETVFDKINEYEDCLPEDMFKEAELLRDQVQEITIQLKADLKTAVEDSQKGDFDENRLYELRKGYSDNPILKRAKDFAKSGGNELADKVAFIEKLKENKIRYLRRWEKIDTVVSVPKGNFYVLLRKKGADRGMVQEALSFFFGLAISVNKNKGSDEPSEFIFIDCEIHGNGDYGAEKGVEVKQFRNGNIYRQDLFSDYKEIPKVRQDSMESLMEIPITGKFELKDNGNFGEYLTAIGVWGVTWYAMVASNSTVTISEESGRYSISIVTSVGTAQHYFQLNEEFGETTPDGYDCRSTVTREVNSLIHVQQLKTSKRTTVRTFSKTKMIVKMDANGVSATRVYKRV